MSTKGKSPTKKQASARGKAGREAQDELTARKLAAIHHAPRTPTEITYAIGEAMLELSSQTGVNLEHPDLFVPAFLIMRREAQEMIKRYGVRFPRSGTSATTKHYFKRCASAQMHRQLKTLAEIAGAEDLAAHAKTVELPTALKAWMDKKKRGKR